MIKRTYLPYSFKAAKFIFAMFAALSILELKQLKASGLDDLLEQPTSDASENPQKGGRPLSNTLKSSLLKSRIGETTAEQIIFFDFFGKGQFEKALFQWKSAFGSTSFASSINGKALPGYLLFKIGIRQGGAELLLRETNLSELDPELARLWSLALADHPEIFKRTALPYNSKWAALFGPLSEVYTKASYIKNSASSEDSNRLRKLTVNNDVSSRFSWMHIQDLIQNEKIDEAAAELKALSNERQSEIGSDLISLTIARVLYQFGYLDKASEYYLKVPKNSPYLVEAAEEQAWTYLRKGEPQKSVDLLKAYIRNDSTHVVGPETFFVHAIAQLKLCNPQQVANDLKMYQKKFNSRMAELAGIVKSQNDKQIIALLNEGARIGSSPVMLDKISPRYSELLERMPRLIVRDSKFIDLADAVQATSEETTAAAKLYERSITGSTDSVGFQAHFDVYRKQAAELHQSYVSLSINYIQDLAKKEIAEIKLMTAKLQILEAELINRSTNVQSTVAAVGSASGIAKASGANIAKASGTDIAKASGTDIAKASGADIAKASGADIAKASGFTNPTILDTEQIKFDDFDGKTFPPNGSCRKSL